MFAKPYAENYDLINSDKPYKKEVDFVYQWADKPKSIFDIGCGTGSYWKHYPEGTNVFGVDRSRYMASQSKAVCADIAKYRHKGIFFETATALFDVLNYIPKHDWWKNIPVRTGGFFVFDIWDTKKIEEEGFQTTLKTVNGLSRRITPHRLGKKTVELVIDFFDGEKVRQEKHRMFLHTHEDILRFCGEHFRIVDTNGTKNWQRWYKCKRK